MLNSGYGALSNQFNRWYADHIAESITLSGQMSVKWVEKAVNNFLNEILKTTDVDFVVAIDTDSVVGETLININGENITIEDYFDQCNGEFVRNDDFNQDYVKLVSDDMALTYKDNQVVSRKVNYVMKHRVKKRMFKIVVADKEVIVTEDHSICVKRAGELIDIKPTQIKRGDMIIALTK